MAQSYDGDGYIAESVGPVTVYQTIIGVGGLGGAAAVLYYQRTDHGACLVCYGAARDHLIRLAVALGLDRSRFQTERDALGDSGRIAGVGLSFGPAQLSRRVANCVTQPGPIRAQPGEANPINTLGKGAKG